MGYGLMKATLILIIILQLHAKFYSSNATAIAHFHSFIVTLILMAHLQNALVPFLNVHTIYS